MNILGWFLAFGGFCGIVFALRMMAKGKKVGSVPFHTPGEIARDGALCADAKGLVSTEGQVDLGPQPLLAPMSGTPCMAYEITIERKWEAIEGDKKTSGSESIFSDYRGVPFGVVGGGGVVRVDASAKPDAAFKKSHTNRQPIGMMIPGTLVFGKLQMNTPNMPRNHGRTTALVGTEKILAPSPTLYVLGALDDAGGAPILTKPKGFGALVFAEGGRESLIGKTRRNMLLGSILGPLFVIGGTLLGVLGPKASSDAAPAASATASAQPAETAPVATATTTALAPTHAAEHRPAVTFQHAPAPKKPQQAKPATEATALHTH